MRIPEEASLYHVGHLRLTNYAHSRVRSFRTIGSLAAALSHSLRLGTIDRRAGTEIESALKALSISANGEGVVSWDLYRSLRRVGNRGLGIYFASQQLHEVMAEDRAKPVATLHLRPSALRDLESIAVLTVGDLIDRVEKGIEESSHSGDFSRTEILTTLQTLAASATGGAVDWGKYAENRGLMLLPTQVLEKWSAREFLSALPTVLREVQERFDKIGSILLNDRVLQKSSDATSLPELAARLGVTKQAVQIREAKFLKMFVDAVRFDSYVSCKFRFRSEFLNPLRSLIGMVDEDRRPVFSAADWRGLFLKCWGVTPEQLGVCQRLVFETLKVSLVPRKPELGGLVVARANCEPTCVQQWSSAAATILRGETVQGLLVRDLHEAIRSRINCRMPSRDDFVSILHSIQSVEFDKSSGCFRAKIEHLIRRSDRCERLLRAEKRPMHLRDLAAKSARASKRGLEPTGAESIADALQEDSRFVHLSKTGFWALAEWQDIEVRTIVDIAFEILKEAKRPVHLKALHEAISTRRSVAKDSVRNLVGGDARFLKVARAHWVLRDNESVQAPAVDE